MQEAKDAKTSTEGHRLGSFADEEPRRWYKYLIGFLSIEVAIGLVLSCRGKLNTG